MIVHHWQVRIIAAIPFLQSNYPYFLPPPTAKNQQTGLGESFMFMCKAQVDILMFINYLFYSCYLQTCLHSSIKAIAPVNGINQGRQIQVTALMVI